MTFSEPVPTYEGDLNEHEPIPDGYDWRTRDLASEPLDLMVEDNTSPSLVISFGGCGINPDTGESMYAMVNLLRDEEVSKVYLRDQFGSWMLNGIRGFSVDVASTVTALRKVIDGLNPSWVTATGGSGGGYAAILYGTLLGADRVFAINPQTLLQPGVQCFAHGGLYRLKWTNPADWAYHDLLNLPVTDTPIEIAHGSGESVDRFHSGRMGERAGVTLLPFKGTHGQLAPDMRDHGILAEMVMSLGNAQCTWLT